MRHSFMSTSQWTCKQMTFIDFNPQNETTVNKGNGLCWKDRMAIKGEFFPMKKINGARLSSFCFTRERHISMEIQHLQRAHT